MKCYRCGEPFALGWWCNRCKWTADRSEEARRVDDNFFRGPGMRESLEAASLEAALWVFGLVGVLALIICFATHQSHGPGVPP